MPRPWGRGQYPVLITTDPVGEGFPVLIIINPGEGGGSEAELFTAGIGGIIMRE